jgi:hypothetical protein
MDPWMDENLVFLQLVVVVLATKANSFPIYNILMIKTYVACLELQYLFDNQLFIGILYCLLTLTIQIIIFLLNIFEL